MTSTTARPSDPEVAAYLAERADEIGGDWDGTPLVFAISADLVKPVAIMLDDVANAAPHLIAKVADHIFASLSHLDVGHALLLLRPTVGITDTDRAWFVACRAAASDHDVDFRGVFVRTQDGLHRMSAADVA